MIVLESNVSKGRAHVCFKPCETRLDETQRQSDKPLLTLHVVHRTIFLILLDRKA